MSISTWDEIRTAYHVARQGTVSGAAEALGVHHATVIRHVDSLEERLGVKLFQRHARGYTATEAGTDLLQVAQATDDQFTQLVGRIRGGGDGLSGELVVTSLSALSPRMTGTLARFRAAYPEVAIRFITGDQLLRLEYGEAHVALRAGAKPEQPDNVVQPFMKLEFTLYASADYIERRGRPGRFEDFAKHDFVTLDGTGARAPFQRWLNENVPESNFVFKASDPIVVRDAILAGMGIGFALNWDAERFDTLVPLFEPQDVWRPQTWLVTHVDLHRTPKVQTFLQFLKEDAKTW